MHTKLLAQLINPVLPASLGGKGITTPDAANKAGLVGTGRLVSSLMSVFLIVTAILSLFYLILGGVAWVTSDGEKGKLEAARNKITQAIIGLVVVASSWALWILIGHWLGINLTNGSGSFTLPFPTLK